jgi:hypothetical protein
MSSKYIVQIKPLHERQLAIAGEIANPERKHRFHGFRNQAIDLPVIRVPLTLPIYRMENYRTRLLQRAWIKERNVPDNFFLEGEENESVQQIQHGFLSELASESRQNIAQIGDILKSEGQKDPLLVTITGVVVNGNRRLSAMREIYKSDTETYAEFQYIDCMVLPAVATEDDLKEIEVKLQMTPETRLPYDWISEAIAVSDLFFNRNKDEAAIALLMGLKDTSKVKNKLRMLTEIELYLKEWKNKEGAYAEVMDAEQIVSELTARFARKSGKELEIARRLGWILLDQRGKNGRVYNYKEVVGNLISDVSNKIQETFPNETDVDDIEDDIQNEETQLELDLGLDIEDPQEPYNQGIVNFLNTAKDNDQLQESIVNLYDIVVEARKQRKNSQAAYKAINEANTRLLAVELSSADSSTYEGVSNQLNSILQRTNALIEELHRLQQAL